VHFEGGEYKGRSTLLRIQDWSHGRWNVKKSNMKYCDKIKSFLIITLSWFLNPVQKLFPNHYDLDRDLSAERDLDFCLSAERDFERLYDLSLLTGEYVGDPLDLRGDLERDLDLDRDLLDELPPPP